MPRRTFLPSEPYSRYLLVATVWLLLIGLVFMALSPLIIVPPDSTQFSTLVFYIIISLFWLIVWLAGALYGYRHEKRARKWGLGVVIPLLVIWAIGFILAILSSPATVLLSAATVDCQVEPRADGSQLYICDGAWLAGKTCSTDEAGIETCDMVPFMNYSYLLSGRDWLPFAWIIQGPNIETEMSGGDTF